MASESVVVRPGMLPAMMIVAPNSPMARAKASSIPPAMPRAASGRVLGATPREVAGGDDRRATLADAAREGERHPPRNAARGERQRDGREDAGVTRAEG